MDKIRKLTLVIILSIFSIFGFAGTLDEYIDVSKCNHIDKKYYDVCWDANLRVPISGWTTLIKDEIDKVNIVKRPPFYKNKEYNSISPSQIGIPNHLGHTFAIDSDNDYSNESLRSTYDMVNITPMNGQVNTGIWRRIENRGKEISRQEGNLIAVTLVEYHDEKKFNLVYPKSYYKIYLFNEVSGGEYLDECYKVDNRPYVKNTLRLADVKVNCEELKIKN